ncbi:hypothetical protein [Streptomyces sp. NPDC001404]|uniref:hypothetical protein n=1 Tax=Streptomyces sp. NPDC001404 TaxID=3364571 RepID=UPI0036C2BDFE
MVNRNKAKGTLWESSVRDYLNKVLGLVDETGAFRDPFSAHNVRRAAQEGAKDVGDIHCPPFILECKHVRNPAVPTWLRQAEVEAKHARFPYGVAVVKVPWANTASGRVHFTVRTWTRVRLALGHTTRDMRELYAFTPTIRGLRTDRWYLTCSLRDFAQVLTDMRTSRVEGGIDAVHGRALTLW